MEHPDAAQTRAYIADVGAAPELMDRKPRGGDARVAARHRVTELWIEASGPFHVARYLSAEQIARLRHLCETGSPVGDTLNRPVSTTLTLDVRSSG